MIECKFILILKNKIIAFMWCRKIFVVFLSGSNSKYKIVEHIKIIYDTINTISLHNINAKHTHFIIQFTKKICTIFIPHPNPFIKIRLIEFINHLTITAYYFN